MAKNALKLSTIVGETFEIYLPQMETIAVKLSTMVGEFFQIYLPQMSLTIFVPDLSLIYP